MKKPVKHSMFFLHSHLNHVPKVAKLILFFIMGLLLVVGTGILSLQFFTPNVQTQSDEQPRLTNTSNLPTPEATIPYTIETVAEGLEVPWSIVFTSRTRMLITERPGRIRVIENGKLRQDPLIQFSEVSSRSEEGHMGLVRDPSYEQNRYLYTSLAYVKNNAIVVKILRLIDNQDSITVDTVILDDIPADTNHAGNRLLFGPDEKLYITTGDATERNLAQDMNSLAGKILRINPDGSIPEDNPFPNSPIYSLGHRNPQGIAFHPETEELYSTEHGPSVFDGPPGGDEVNHIRAGNNYGWPLVSHEKKREGMTHPLVVYTPAVAPASLMIYSGSQLPQFTNNLFFGGLRGAGLYRVVLDTQDPDTVLYREKMSDIQMGRIREVIEGPDGYIYFSTSNRDGRGSPKKGDDKVLRLVPQQ